MHENRICNRKVVVKDTEKLAVTGVAASGATTLTITGTKLGELTTDSFKVSPEIAVTAYAAAADGKTATVTLASAMMSAAKYTVTVLEQSYEVTYTVGEITSVAVTETTYDDDTAGQVVAITVNGGSPITVNDLIADGYYVSFSATKDGASKAIFAGTAASATSMTGELVSKFDGTGDAKVDSYQIQVVLTKGSTIITSPLATIKIANLNASATEIKSYELTGTSTGASTEDVVLTGNTLVVGEAAKLTKATITTKDGAVELPSAVLSLVSISSSDKGVISVNTSVSGEVSIEAMAPGTATLTFSYGSVSKTATYTVTNTARKVASVVAKDSVVRLTSSNTSTGVDTTIVVKDQYGEFYNGLSVESANNAPVAGSNGVAYTSNANLALVSVAGSTTTDKNGEFKATVKAVSATTVGSAYLMVSYWDAAQNKTAYTAASIVVTAATAADPSKNQLYAKHVAGDNKSDDLNLNIYKTDDDTVDLALKTFTKDNALVEAAVDLKDYYFKYNKAIIDVTAGSTTPAADGSTIYTVASSATEVNFTAKGKGSTTVSLYDKDNKLVATAVVTVTDTTPKLTAVTFNSKCPTALTTAGEYVDLTQVFNIKASANDPIIEGLTVSEAYAGELRLDITGATAEIYIDANSDGDYNTSDGDYIVGSIKLTAKESNGSAATAPTAFTYTLTTGGSAKTLYYTVYDGASTDTSAKVIAAKTISVSL